MTATLPDCRRDPPELERDMPGAHLDTEAGQFMFRVSVLDSAFNSLQKKNDSNRTPSNPTRSVEG